MNNLVNLAKFKRKKAINAVLIIIVALSVITIAYLKENPILPDIEIAESKNISYNLSPITSITPEAIIDKINKNKGKPILLHFYASWCRICFKQTPIINEAARKFQNTDLKTIIVSIEKNASPSKISNYLFRYGDIYFKSHYLLYSYGLQDLLERKEIYYNRKVPFTVVIDRSGEVIAKYSGIKNQRYLNSKIMKALQN